MAEHRCCWEQPCNRCNADTLLFRREKFAGFVPSVSACCRSALHARNHATPYVNVNGTPNGERYNVANGCGAQGGAELPLQGGREANEQLLKRRGSGGRREHPADVREANEHLRIGRAGEVDGDVPLRIDLHALDRCEAASAPQAHEKRVRQFEGSLGGR